MTDRTAPESEGFPRTWIKDDEPRIEGAFVRLDRAPAKDPKTDEMREVPIIVLDDGEELVSVWVFPGTILHHRFAKLRSPLQKDERVAIHYLGVRPSKLDPKRSVGDYRVAFPDRDEPVSWEESFGVPARSDVDATFDDILKEQRDEQDADPPF